MKAKLVITNSYCECLEVTTTYLKEQGNGLDAQSLVFTEDKMTLQLERRILDKLGGYFGLQVTSFNKYLLSN